MAKINVYCVKHEENHCLTLVEAINLIHVYQYNMAHYAYDNAMPHLPYSNPDVVLSRTLCPLHDLETVDTDKNPLSRAAQYVQYMLELRTLTTKKSRKKAN